MSLNNSNIEKIVLNFQDNHESAESNQPELAGLSLNFLMLPKFVEVFTVEAMEIQPMDRPGLVSIVDRWRQLAAYYSVAHQRFFDLNADPLTVQKVNGKIVAILGSNGNPLFVYLVTIFQYQYIHLDVIREELNFYMQNQFLDKSQKSMS
jgi:hypothetical protein